jgi:hypothetical protein
MDKEAIRVINEIIHLNDDVKKIRNVIDKVDTTTEHKINIDDALHLCCYYNLSATLKLLLEKGY